VRAGRAESGLVKRECTGSTSLADSRSDSQSLCCQIHASLAIFFSPLQGACSQASAQHTWIMSQISEVFYVTFILEENIDSVEKVEYQ